MHKNKKIPKSQSSRHAQQLEQASIPSKQKQSRLIHTRGNKHKVNGANIIGRRSITTTAARSSRKSIHSSIVSSSPSLSPSSTLIKTTRKNNAISTVLNDYGITNTPIWPKKASFSSIKNDQNDQNDDHFQNENQSTLKTRKINDSNGSHLISQDNSLPLSSPSLAHPLPQSRTPSLTPKTSGMDKVISKSLLFDSGIEQSIGEFDDGSNGKYQNTYSTHHTHHFDENPIDSSTYSRSVEFLETFDPFSNHNTLNTKQQQQKQQQQQRQQRHELSHQWEMVSDSGDDQYRPNNDHNFDHSSSLSGGGELPKPPRVKKLKNDLENLHVNLKSFLVFNSPNQVYDLVSSPEFKRIEDTILLAKQQSFKTQASQTIIPLTVVRKWLIKSARQNPDVPFYNIINDSISDSFPDIDGFDDGDNDSDGDNDNNNSGLLKKTFSTLKNKATGAGGQKNSSSSSSFTFFNKLKNQTLKKQRQNLQGIWIMRRLFWKESSELDISSNIPVEWAQLIGCIAEDRPYTNLQGLSSLSLYTQICGFPSELYDPLNKTTLSQSSNKHENEVIGHIVTQIIKSSPFLYENFKNLQLPSSQCSILSTTWFQSIIKMVTLVLAFETRLTHYQVNIAQVDTHLIPFATILKKHFTSNGQRLYRKSPTIPQLDEKFNQIIEIDLSREKIQKNLINFDPFFSKRRDELYLGGNNISSLSNSLQIDDLFMLVASIGEILNKFSIGVKSPRGVPYSSQPYSNPLGLDGIEKLLLQVMDEIDMKKDYEKKVKEDDLKLKEELKKEKRNEMMLDLELARLNKNDENYNGNGSGGQDNGENGDDLEKNGQNGSKKSKLLPFDSEFEDSINNNDNNIDNNDEIVYIPTVSKHFIDHFDESKGFLNNNGIGNDNFDENTGFIIENSLNSNKNRQNVQNSYNNISGHNINQFLNESTIVKAYRLHNILNPSIFNDNDNNSDDDHNNNNHHPSSSLALRSSSSSSSSSKIKDIINFDLMRSKYFCSLNMYPIDKMELLYGDGDDNDDSDDNKNSIGGGNSRNNGRIHGNSSRMAGISDNLDQDDSNRYFFGKINDKNELLVGLDQLYLNMLVQNEVDLTNANNTSLNNSNNNTNQVPWARGKKNNI